MVNRDDYLPKIRSLFLKEILRIIFDYLFLNLLVLLYEYDSYNEKNLNYLKSYGNGNTFWVVGGEFS